jgi:hypothetical protein
MFFEYIGLSMSHFELVPSEFSIARLFHYRNFTYHYRIPHLNGDGKWPIPVHSSSRWRLGFGQALGIESLDHVILWGEQFKISPSDIRATSHWTTISSLPRTLFVEIGPRLCVTCEPVTIANPRSTATSSHRNWRREMRHRHRDYTGLPLSTIFSEKDPSKDSRENTVQRKHLKQ